ncbi:hypothetical protein [Hymenobacter sp. B81]|uniref:hypothetical protein n=1 Tax=Hymenobacter sp. B81 TaxID=3344878 RepID=UPI0037DCB779
MASGSRWAPLRRLALGGLLGLLGWASWEAPRRPAPTEPIRLVRLRVAGLRTPQQARALEQQLRAVPGVTASTFHAPTQVLTLRYRAPEVSAGELTRIVSVGGVLPVQVLPAAAPGYGPLERLRYALNLRRLLGPR